MSAFALDYGHYYTHLANSLEYFGIKYKIFKGINY